MDKFRSNKLLAALVLLPVIFCIACAIAFRAICTHEVRTARFGQLEMYGESGNYISISSSQPAGCNLFVEIPDEGQFPIAAVPQEVLNRRFKKGEMKNRLWYSHGFDLELTYEDGRLHTFRGRNISIRRTLQDTSISLPISYAELHAAWGEPDTIDSRRTLIRNN